MNIVEVSIADDYIVNTLHAHAVIIKRPVFKVEVGIVSIFIVSIYLKSILYIHIYSKCEYWELPRFHA